MECWLSSFVISRGSGPVLLKTLYFCDFPGGWDPDPCPPSGSARVLQTLLYKKEIGVLSLIEKLAGAFIEIGMVSTYFLSF